ncbi:hypothetical protein PRIC2_007718 [Phytophthora ramorum]
MAPGLDAREAIADALEANRALVAELRSLEQSLANEEAKLLARTQSIRRQMALRRAQQAMDALLPRTAPHQKLLPGCEKSRRTRKKPTGVVPRSYIRQQVSFFTDHTETQRKVGRPKKKKPKTVAAHDQESEEQAKLRALPEPPVNADTEFLRAHSHEAFVAGPPTIFTARERRVLKDFATEYFSLYGRGNPIEIPLHAWNSIQTWQGLRKSREFPIERSGFACKLWYDLHESPKLRLGAWTKQEDAALRRLATGEEDPGLVNKWHEIADRMPIPGRPAVHCLTRYQTTLCGGNVRTNFTPQEDEILREAVPVFGEKWNVIADLLDGRLSEQIRHRWQLSLAPGLRRGKFSLIEDRRLLLALRAYVSTGSEFNQDQVAWNEISHHIRGRTQPAIRDRYSNSMNPDLSFRKFTKQEDEIILARVREWGIDSPRLWARLATEMDGRTDSQVARRWKTLDPEAWEQRRRALAEAGKTQTTAVFRRRSIPRHDPRLRKHTLRSSYNGLGDGEVEVIGTASVPNSRVNTKRSRRAQAVQVLEAHGAEGDDGCMEISF